MSSTENMVKNRDTYIYNYMRLTINSTLLFRTESNLSDCLSEHVPVLLSPDLVYIINARNDDQNWKKDPVLYFK